jgi:hypothetical protein
MGAHRHLVRVATFLVFAVAGFSQGSDLTVLTVRIENLVQYLSDVSDSLKIGTQPGMTPKMSAFKLKRRLSPEPW